MPIPISADASRVGHSIYGRYAVTSEDGLPEELLKVAQLRERIKQQAEQDREAFGRELLGSCSLADRLGNAKVGYQRMTLYRPAESIR